MKKFFKLIVMSVFLIFAMVGLTACPEPSEFQSVIDALDGTSSCAQINQTISIRSVSNNMLMYKQKKQFVKDSGGYEVLIEESKLNTLDKDEPWTENEDTDYVSNANYFASSIKFDKEYFKSYTNPSGAKLFNANIKDEYFDTVFGVNVVHDSIVNAVLTITLESNGVSDLTVNFTYRSQTAGSYLVEVKVEYYY